MLEQTGMTQIKLWLTVGNVCLSVKSPGACTLQPLYNTVCYNKVLDITRFKDESQKCIDYIEK